MLVVLVIAAVADRTIQGTSVRSNGGNSSSSRQLIIAVRQIALSHIIQKKKKKKNTSTVHNPSLQYYSIIIFDVRQAKK